jgi:hypothetical protein
MDYKKYSLENLENWLHDAMSSGEATPQEIYDTIRKTVQEEYYYHKDKASKTNELLVLLNGHRSVSFINDNNSTDSWTKEDVLRQRDYYGPIKNNSTLTTNDIVDFSSRRATDTITFTSCDSTNTSPDCSQHWNSFWNDQYLTPKDAINNLAFTQVGDFTVYNNATKDSFISSTSSPFVSEDGDVWGKEKIREYNLREAEYYNKRTELDAQYDKVTKWVLPVEVDGLTGDCVVTLPDDLLERVGWVEGDTVEFVSNTNGSFTVKKVVKSEV